MTKHVVNPASAKELKRLFTALATGLRDTLASLTSRKVTLTAGGMEVTGTEDLLAGLDKPNAVARAALDKYGQRLDRCEAAFDVAEERYGAPLHARDDLRGLLGAYQTRAARAGLAEDPELTEAYWAARELLWSAPCDLDKARALVDHYQHAVRVAVGVEHPVERDSGDS